MFHTCEISTCDSPTLITCVCCNKSLCREHFVEHDYLLRPKLNELTKQINKIFDQFESLDMKTIMSDSLKKIDEWRLNSYQVIDKFYENKCTELNYYINNILNKYAKDINDLRLKIEKMTYIQQTTNHNIELLTKNIQTLQQQINQIKYISIQVDIRPLVIIDKLIDVNIITDLSKLSTPYQTIQRIPLCSNAMASNNQYLLIHQNSKLYLIDENLFIIRQNHWFYDQIQDMCWSKILNCFFIITLHDIYQVEINTLLVKQINTTEKNFWQSCTCSDTSLYLSNESIIEFNLKPSIQYVKSYKRNETIDHKQRIDSIEYNNGKLILAINDQSKQEIFIELRLLTTFDCLWLCQLNIEYSERKIQCCLYNYDTWLIADWGNSSLIYLTKDGKIKNSVEYQNEIHYINQFGSNKVVISTDHSIHFHKL
ncbi:unnamed protein product [Adineta steineri]|uniref:B box-type domain-containing protein n=2 Tax=Adineta steineri TaxID=433720 RepID=A0A819AN37_9BILA|nr:unnamed protein product [Adineta steineri]CAF3788294.1 unnamed protein product [Adineta steineri]